MEKQKIIRLSMRKTLKVKLKKQISSLQQENKDLKSMVNSLELENIDAAATIKDSLLGEVFYKEKYEELLKDNIRLKNELRKLRVLNYQSKIV